MFLAKKRLIFFRGEQKSLWQEYFWCGKWGGDAWGDVMRFSRHPRYLP